MDSVSYWFFNKKKTNFSYGNLDDIHRGVGRLKLLAEQMNRELEDQKPITDRLTQKIEVLNENVQKKNQNMKTILLR